MLVDDHHGSIIGCIKKDGSLYKSPLDLRRKQYLQVLNEQCINLLTLSTI